MKYTDQSNGLPSQPSAPLQPTPTTFDNDIILDKRPASQYKIPQDPLVTVRIPEFKPLNSITSTYSLSLGPIESVTKHAIIGPNEADDTIGTVLATAYSNKQVVVDKSPIPLPPPPPPPSKTITKLHAPLSHPPPPLPPPKGILLFADGPTLHHTHKTFTHTINAQPLDLYHTMTLKNDPVRPNLIQRAPPQKHRPPTHSHPSIFQPNSPQFEIQKSIEYQLHWIFLVNSKFIIEIIWMCMTALGCSLSVAYTLSDQSFIFPSLADQMFVYLLLYTNRNLGVYNTDAYIDWGVMPFISFKLFLSRSYHILI